MLTAFLAGKKASLLLGAVTGTAIATLSQVTTASTVALPREASTFWIGVITFILSTLSSVFVSGRVVGKMEGQMAIMSKEIHDLKQERASLVDKESVSMLDRLLTEKIADVKTAVERLSAERAHQYEIILRELRSLRQHP